jgi:hypothetical protein
MKTTVFCDIAPCSLVDVERRFRGTYYLHHQVDKCLHWEPYEIQKYRIQRYWLLKQVIHEITSGHWGLNRAACVACPYQRSQPLQYSVTESFVLTTSQFMTYIRRKTFYRLLWCNGFILGTSGSSPSRRKLFPFECSIPNVVVKRWTLLFRILVIPGSNPDPESGYPDWIFRSFSQSLQANIRLTPYN